MNGNDFCGTSRSFVTLPSPQPVTINGPMATGTISTAGHFATFSFTGKQAQVIAPLYSATTFTGGSLSTSVQDSAGNQLAATQGTYTLPADGTCTVVLDGGGGTGSVNLGVYDASPVSSTANGPSVDVPIISGQQTVVSFAGNAGDTVSAQFNPSSPTIT